MIPRRSGVPSALRALLLALVAVVLPSSAQASLASLGDVKNAIPELSTALPRELPGPCEGELCSELDAPQPKTRVRGFELDLYCRLGGEGDLSCRPRQVWVERYDGSASDRSVFTGHYFDTETNLYYAKARYFDPQLGRFLSQDSYLGELTEPPSLHRYLYAHDRPTFYVDPDGHVAFIQDWRKSLQETKEWWLKEAENPGYTRQSAKSLGTGAGLVGWVDSTLGLVNAAADVGVMYAADPAGATYRDAAADLSGMMTEAETVISAVRMDPLRVATSMALSMGRQQLGAFLGDGRAIAEQEAFKTEIGVDLVLGSKGSKFAVDSVRKVGTRAMEFARGFARVETVGADLAEGLAATRRTGLLNSLSLTDEGLPAFDPEKLTRIEASLRKQGVTTVFGEAAEGRLAKLDSRGLYEGIAEGQPGQLSLPRNPSRIAVVEELMHLGQHRKTGWSRITQELAVSMELEAQERLVGLGRKLGWVGDEMRSIKQAQSYWREMGIKIGLISE